MKKCYSVRCHGGWHEGFESKEEAEDWARDNAGTFYSIFSYEVSEPCDTIKVPPPEAVPPEC